MTTARNKAPGRKPSSGGMFTGADLASRLDTQEGYELLERLNDATCDDTPLDRYKHIKQVALVVLHARRERP